MCVCVRVSILYVNVIVILIVFYGKSEGNDTSSSSYYHYPSMIRTPTINRTKQKPELAAHTTSMTERRKPNDIAITSVRQPEHTLNAHEHFFGFISFHYFGTVSFKCKRSNNIINSDPLRLYLCLAFLRCLQLASETAKQTLRHYEFNESGDKKRMQYKGST